jgi:GDP-mannose 6-dehydrogenase
LRISVFGLGYVGTVSAGCLARNGHQVIGVDPNTAKAEMINSGQSPIIETGIGEIIAKATEEGRLSATTDPQLAVRETDLSLICVGTPSRPNGSLDTSFLVTVCREIGEALKEKEGFHLIVVRSTVLPGTNAREVVPELERASGKKVGVGFGLCSNPEFLREGSAVFDFDHPPKTVIGESDARSGEMLAQLYEDLDAPLICVEIPIAELVKYADNCWHATKITFANEIGNIAKAVDVDSHRVMEIFCQDLKLNISSAYLKPGQAFGGSCLPKDVRAITHRARDLDVEAPLLSSLLPSNQIQMKRALQMVLDKKNRKIGILGFSFKAGTDDLRESPMVELIERLIGKGFDLKIYDRNVSIAKLVGANRSYILHHIPHISDLMVDTIEEVLQHGETIVIGNGDPAFKIVADAIKDNQAVVDLVRVAPKWKGAGVYDGICW